MIKDEYPFWFFVLLLIAVLYLFFSVFQPFLMILLWATILVSTFHPLYRWLVQKLRGRQTLAAMLMVLGLTLALVLPLLVAMAKIAQQSMDAYLLISSKLEGQGDIQQSILQHPTFLQLKQSIGSFVNLDKLDLKTGVVKAVEFLSAFIVDQTTTLFSTAANLLFNFVLFLVATFSLFRDGDALLHEIRKLSPLDKSKEEKILNRFTSVTRATLLGNFATAVLQGVLGGIGFALLGLPSAILWGAVMALVSMVPVFGAFTIWIPTAIYLISAGSAGKAVFLLVWGAVVVGLSDYILKPMIIKGGFNIHPVIIFFSILGGVSFFGFTGLILGPLVTGLTFAFLEIYREEFSAQLPGTVKLSRNQVEGALREMEDRAKT